MAIRLASYPVAGSRRRHDRVDLSRQQVEAWLLLERATGESTYSSCQLLNLSYAGMCLQGEDLFEVGKQYRFILDLSAVLGTEAEVAARIVWKQPMEAGLCYVGAAFVKSSASWLGPNEDDDPGAEMAPGGNGGSG